MSWMLEEIRQQPEVLRRLLAEGWGEAEAIVADVRRRDVRFVVMAARGSSDNAARYGQYLFGNVLGLQVALATPSLFTLYRTPPRLRDALVIGISQSGQSTDIVTVVAEARRQGAPTVAITNDPASPLAEAAEHLFPLRAGQERAVAATKTYTAQLMALAMLATAWIGDTGRREALQAVPDRVQAALDLAPAVEEALPVFDANRCVVLGRGYNFCTAYEVALKLKETCNLPAEPFSPADFMHGPIALLEEGFPVLLVAPGGAAFEYMLEVAAHLRDLRARLVVVSDREEILTEASQGIRLPGSLDECCSPMVSVVPGQLLAHALAVARGRDPDRPRGLTKVTITR